MKSISSSLVLQSKRVLPSAVLATSMALATSVQAQTAPQAAPSESSGLAEIVVTAQKREQSVQDVPIAVTAITQEALQDNRVENVADLSGLAPNMVVRPAAGGTEIPAFSMRGITSYGVVPGSDKETSIYLDGVYISSSNGSIFQLPDAERIEVLRGPQGTLFGRNSTAGAINVVTRDPSGEFKVTQEVTAGNYNQFRTRTSVDLPAVGPLSAYITFVHNERRGDIRNLGADTVWDKSGPDTGLGVQYSPKYLGDNSDNSWFAAVKFEPNDSFRTTFKFDYAFRNFTPDGQAVIGFNPNAPLIGSLFSAVLGSQPTPVAFDNSATRPSAVNDSYATPGRQLNEGEVLTSELTITNNLSLKNIAAFRKAFIATATQLDGLGGLEFTPQSVLPYSAFVAYSTLPPAAAAAAIPGYAAFFGTQVGSRFSFFPNTAQDHNQQWSDELQLNYDSKLVTLTAGALIFHQQDESGSPGFQGTFNFQIFPASGRVPLGNESDSFNRAKSYAGYTQAEVHIAPEVDFVGGVRVTHDDKSGVYDTGGTYIPGPGGSFTTGTYSGVLAFPFTYSSTKPTYSAGINYKPFGDSGNTLIYGKFSTGFVSGGSVGGVGFEPETVKSWEGGLKADFWGHRLRTNIAIFTANYDNVQSAQGGVNVGHPELGTVIIDQGTVKAKGFEFEASALPVTGLTLGWSVGYTDVYFGYVNPILLAAEGGAYQPTLIPKWTTDLSGKYETMPLFDNARLAFSTNGSWRAREQTLPNAALATEIPAFAPLLYSPAGWIVNARLALREIQMGPVEGEIAIWGRNINNNKTPLFPLTFGTYVASSDFQPAPTYGIDLIGKF
jgi:iron complex outermembrane recepter protein